MANLGEVLDKAGVAVLWNKIKSALGDKVDKVSGKGLSTNDYDNTEKSHVGTAYNHSQAAHAPSNAEKNVVVGIQKNGTDLAVDTSTRKVNVTVPVKTSELTNDAGFITEADVPEGSSASTAIPLMDGTAAVGTSTAFARGDHRHPTDTSRAADSEVVHLNGNESIGGVKTFTEPVSFEGKTINLPNGETTPFIKSDSNGLHFYGYSATDDGTYGNVYLNESKLGSISACNSVIFNLKAPENDSCATNKQYVDTAITNAVTDCVAKENGKGLSTNDYTTAEKNKLAAFDSADSYAKKSDITSMYKYKGSKANYAALPATGNTAGDVWNVEDTGMNYAWTGSAWDALGSVFTITAITAAEIEEICV